MHPVALLVPGPPDLSSGWPAFDALGLVRPGRVLLVDVGTPTASRVLMGLLAGCIASGREAVVVDGSNWIDCYRLGDAARILGLSRDDALACVRVARGFTAHQLQALVEDALPSLLDESPVGLALVPGLPDMYLDDDLDRSEARILLARALDALGRQARRHDVPIVVSNAVLSPRSRLAMRRVLDEGSHARVALLPEASGGLRIVRSDGRALVAPAPGARQRLLDEYAPPLSACARMPASAFATRGLDPRLRHASKHAGELRFHQRQQTQALAGGA